MTATLASYLSNSIEVALKKPKAKTKMMNELSVRFMIEYFMINNETNIQDYDEVTKNFRLEIGTST